MTNTGGLIICSYRGFIDEVELPLDVGTDMILYGLLVSFPENFDIATKSGKKFSMSYIC